MKRKMLTLFKFFFIALFIIVMQPGWTTKALAEKLPVFKLKPTKLNRGQAENLLMDLNKGKVPPGQIKKNDREDSLVSEIGKKRVEVSRASGAIFAIDGERLWNPEHKPALPPKKQSRDIAEKFLNKHKLRSEVARKHAHVKFDDFSATKAMADAPGAQPIDLDTQVNYKVEVNVNRGGRSVSLPVVGGGGKFKVYVGDRGDVVGFHKNWRGIDRVQSEMEILPQQEAEGKFRQAHKNLNLTRVESFLAYYSAPSIEKQDVLAPVWVIKATAKVGNEEIPMRNTIVGATKYGPEIPLEQVPPRNPNYSPPPPTKEPERQGNLSLVRSAWASSPGTAGSWYLNTCCGLRYSQANAAGFRDTLRSAGWNVRFYYGENNAWESDWRANNNSYVDAVDFVFYSGHASPYGWSLRRSGGNDSLTDAEVRAHAPDLYGNNQLEWLIIAACGPMQHPTFTSNINSAFDRWRKIFNGLHVFLGYGAVTYDNTTEGRRVAQLANAGWPIIDAWFQAAAESQPSNNGYSAPNGPRIYATAMYPYGWRYDRIWGNFLGRILGSNYDTLPDPPAGRQLWLMWSGT